MLVNTAQTFDVSSSVTLRFVLPPVATGLAVQTGGEVVRVQEAKSMAIEFVGLRPPYREAIARYVEQTKKTGAPAELPPKLT